MTSYDKNNKDNKDKKIGIIALSQKSLVDVLIHIITNGKEADFLEPARNTQPYS